MVHVGLLIVISIIVVIISLLMTKKVKVVLNGKWVASPCVTAAAGAGMVSSTPSSLRYNAVLTEVTTLSMPWPIGTSVSYKQIDLSAAGGSITFHLCGAGGALFVTGGREYTVRVSQAGTGDIKVKAVSKAGDEVGVSVNYNGGRYPDPDICPFETTVP